MKERVDVLLVNQGFFETREKAKRSIMAGLVYVEQEKVLKPGERVDTNKELTVKGHLMPYVSRGGLKLEKALKSFRIDLNGRIMVDVGASTGGFTDCALQNGISLVYAIDVGYNQLDWKIRSNPSVITMERLNFRFATKELFSKGIPNFASIDVSFISLRLILPVLYTIIEENCEVVALIKPQFEAGREQVGKNGIIKDPIVHRQVVEDIITFAKSIHFSVLGLDFSPIKGTEGNIEFLLHLQKTTNESHQPISVDAIVKEAHEL